MRSDNAEPMTPDRRAPHDSALTLDEYFADRDRARALFEAVRAEVEALGPAEVRVSKSQIAFTHGHNVAVLWTPDRYLDPARSAPLVLTISLKRHHPSPRWKQVTAVGGGRYTHHLELHSADEIDDEVRGWLAEAWTLAEAGR